MQINQNIQNPVVINPVLTRLQFFRQLVKQSSNFCVQYGGISSIAKQCLIYTLKETAFVGFVGWIGDTSTQQVPKSFGYFKWWSPNIIITSSKNDVLGLSEEKLKKREKMLTM
eukprot:scaffold27574_cov61-Cyclotella_meneghiniana.AAC.1